MPAWIVEAMQEEAKPQKTPIPISYASSDIAQRRPGRVNLLHPLIAMMCGFTSLGVCGGANCISETFPIAAMAIAGVALLTAVVFFGIAGYRVRGLAYAEEEV
jgi:hypothetical protein